MELSQKFFRYFSVLFLYFYISSSVFVNGKSKFCKHDNNSSGTPVRLDFPLRLFRFPPQDISLHELLRHPLLIRFIIIFSGDYF